MTPYQQSLIKEGKTRTLKLQISEFVAASVVFALGAGFYARSMGKLPAAIDGWLMIATVCFVILNIVFAGLAALMWGSSLLTHFAMKKLEDDPDWQMNSEALQYKCRKLTVTLATRVKVVGWIQATFVKVFDAFADIFLFTALVTANHPWIAAFNAMAIIAQYYFAFKTKKVVMEMIEMLPDPLEQTTEDTDIDDLMDKLCNPKEKK